MLSGARFWIGLGTLVKQLSSRVERKWCSYSDSCLPENRTRISQEHFLFSLPPKSNRLSPRFQWSFGCGWVPLIGPCHTRSWWRVKRTPLTIRNVVREETKSPLHSLPRSYLTSLWNAGGTKRREEIMSQEDLFLLVPRSLSDSSSSLSGWQIRHLPIYCCVSPPCPGLSAPWQPWTGLWMSCVPWIVLPGYYHLLPKLVIEGRLLCLNISIFYCLE